MILGDLGRLSTKMVVSGIFALNIEVKIAAQSPVIQAVPGVITPPLPHAADHPELKWRPPTLGNLIAICDHISTADN